MSAIETLQPGDNPSDPTSRPSAAEVTGWLLEGRWFTVDLEGAITSWSPAATERFGWKRPDIAGQSFVDALLAPSSHAVGGEAVASALSGPSVGHAGFTGDVDAVDVAGSPLRAAFALVPIQLSVGYEFNALLQEISSRANSRASVSELKAKHQSVLTLIESALSGKAAEAAQTEGGGRLAGALVVFRAADASALPARPDNVVSIADAAGVEEARSQLDRARTDLEAARTEVRNLTGQLEEARREAQRARNEADMARQEAGDARDTLAVSQRQLEESQRQNDEVRRSADEARAAAEEARIRAEQFQREAESLRSQLRDARESVRGAMGQADQDAALARADADRARADAAAARAESARHAAEVETLRGRLLETQREVGTLRAEVETARAELTQGAALSERRGSEAERLRKELEEARAESERLTAEFNKQASESADAVAQLDRARGELEALRAAAARPPVAEGEQGRLVAAFASAPVATAIVAPDGRFLEVNAALCEILGFDRGRLLSDAPPAVVHPDDLAEKRALAARMLAGELGSARGSRRYVHADGHSLTMRESISLVRNESGGPELFVLQLEHAADPTAAVVDVELASEEPDGPSHQELRRALEQERFELHAQPVLDLRTNGTTQYELLIRMLDEDDRLILPQAFLGAARRAGLAHAIDRWVVRRAIRLLACCDDEVRLEVNLSPEAVHDTELPTLIDQELATTPVDPGRLILEVTGQTAADDIESARTLAKRIRAIGCRFALDDFRSTFGSFRLMKDLPLDYLKLDGDLVGSLAESRTSQLIVKALVEVAAGTGTKTVAVFVSDDDTLALLRQQGVDYAQGYTVGRPKPIGDIWPAASQAALPPGES